MDGRISWFISPDLKQISCRCSGALAAPAWSSSSSLPLRFARTCRSFSVRDTSGHTTKQNALISRNTLAEKLCNINLPSPYPNCIFAVSVATRLFFQMTPGPASPWFGVLLSWTRSEAFPFSCCRAQSSFPHGMSCTILFKTACT